MRPFFYLDIHTYKKNKIHERTFNLKNKNKIKKDKSSYYLPGFYLVRIKTTELAVAIYNSN